MSVGHRAPSLTPSKPLPRAVFRSIEPSSRANRCGFRLTSGAEPFFSRAVSALHWDHSVLLSRPDPRAPVDSILSRSHCTPPLYPVFSAYRWDPPFTVVPTLQANTEIVWFPPYTQHPLNSPRCSVTPSASRFVKPANTTPTSAHSNLRFHGSSRSCWAFQPALCSPIVFTSHP